MNQCVLVAAWGPKSKYAIANKDQNNPRSSKRAVAAATKSSSPNISAGISETHSKTRYPTPSFIQRTTALSLLACYLPQSFHPPHISPRKHCPSDPSTRSVRSSLDNGAVAVIHHESSSQQLRLFSHNPTFPVTAPTHVSCQAEQSEWCGQLMSGLMHLRIQ